MAKLSSFKRDAKVRESGAWISPGDEYDGLEILTRGFTNAYRDAVAAKMRQAAVPFLTDQMRVPAATRQMITVDCLVEHVLLDVRGICDDAGPVPFAKFCDLLRDPLYDDLYTAVVKASAQADQIKAATAGDAAGNSAAPSA